MDCDQFSCNDPVIDAPIASTFIHYGYDRRSISRENDIALVELRTAIKYSGTFFSPHQRDLIAYVSIVPIRQQKVFHPFVCQFQSSREIKRTIDKELLRPAGMKVTPFNFNDYSMDFFSFELATLRR